MAAVNAPTAVETTGCWRYRRKCAIVRRARLEVDHLASVVQLDASGCNFAAAPSGQAA